MYETNDGNHVICLPDKCVQDVFVNVFQLRLRLHQFIYQQQKVTACELMLVDIMRSAAEVLEYTNSSGKQFKLLHCYKDIVAFSKTTDAILQIIEYLPDSRLEKAKHLIKRLHLRDIYKCCGWTTNLVEGKSKASIAQEILNIANFEKEILSSEDIIVNFMSIHHGMKKRNPNDFMYFFKKNTSYARHIRAEKYETATLPNEFELPALRIYARNLKDVPIISNAFSIWSKRAQCSTPLCSQAESDYSYENVTRNLNKSS